VHDREVGELASLLGDGIKHFWDTMPDVHDRNPAAYGIEVFLAGSVVHVIPLSPHENGVVTVDLRKQKCARLLHGVALPRAEMQGRDRGEISWRRGETGAGHATAPRCWRYCA
jgi:hypothetical protein